MMIKWIVGLGFLWGIVEASLIKIRRITGDTVGLKSAQESFRIVFVSDIHLDTALGFNHFMMRKLIKRIQSQKPDLVIIGGDLIQKPRSYQNPAFAYLKALDVDCIAVLGNHDYLDLDAVQKGYQDAGIPVLVNEQIVYRGYTIYGVDDYRKGSPYIPAVGSEHHHSILISHEPEVLRKNPNARQFALGLSGHHHGGHITVFGCYAPAVRSEFGQDLVKGFVKEGNLTGYVSSGIGGVPFRFFACPEIVVLDL